MGHLTKLGYSLRMHETERPLPSIRMIASRVQQNIPGVVNPPRRGPHTKTQAMPKLGPGQSHGSPPPGVARTEKQMERTAGIRHPMAQTPFQTEARSRAKTPTPKNVTSETTEFQRTTRDEREQALNQ